MPKRLELTGEKFGRLTVIGFSHIDSSGRSKWNCSCICGETKTIASSSLMSGLTKSCGCLRKETIIKNSKKHGLAKRDKKHYLYSTWKNMRNRCNNPNNDDYEYYGGLGVKVCKRWDNFQNFIDDMGDRPEGMTLDRINPNGNYCKNNCQWTTIEEQRNNQRPNRKIPSVQGSKHGQAKLTEEDVLYIREEYKKGKLQRELAGEMNIRQAHVSAIILRKTWRHI